MNALDLIFKIRSRGYSVIVDGSCLDITPISDLPMDDIPAELLHQLEQNKPEILCALHREAELIRLVFLVSNHRGLSQQEYQEAFANALRDQPNSLIQFAIYAHTLGLL